MRASSKTFSLLAASFLAIGVLAGTTGGCGSSSGGGTGGTTGTGGVTATGGTSATGGSTGTGGSSATVSSLCNEYCTKCYASTAAACESTCNSEFGNTTGSAACISTVQTCINMTDCTQVTTCLMNSIPTCQGGSGGTSGSQTGGAGGHGTGGAGGHATGGTSGAAGSSGSTDCSICTTFVSSGCCAAYATSQGQSTTTCSLVSAACTASPSSVVPTCQTGMTNGAAAGLSGCK